MAMAVQQQPDDNDSEGVWRRPEEQGTGRDDGPTTTTVMAFEGSPSTRVRPDFCYLPVRVRASREGRCESSGR